jgi:hypothetical protein
LAQDEKHGFGRLGALADGSVRWIVPGAIIAAGTRLKK